MNPRNPDERAAGLAPAPGAPAGIPTGGEVYSDTAAPATTAPPRAPSAEAEETYGAQGVQALADEYLARLADLADDLADHASRYVGEGQQAVREHPAPAIGGAFAVALLAGFVLGLRS